MPDLILRRWTTSTWLLWLLGMLDAVLVLVAVGDLMTLPTRSIFSAERKAVRRLLDVLVERQLARRLDALFSGTDELGIGALLSGDGKSQDWGDLDSVVTRALGLPSGAGVVGFDGPSLDRLEYFAGGSHRE